MHDEGPAFLSLARLIVSPSQNMFKVLTGLHVEGAEMDVARFVDTIFEKLGQNESGEISWQVFQSGVKVIDTFLRTLGSRKASCYRSPSGRKGGPVVFGGEKWRFILNMMLGLEYAVREINQLSDLAFFLFPQKFFRELLVYFQNPYYYITIF